MTLKKFHLIKDRYLFDDYDSGLYFDLYPIKRGVGDEDDFNSRIDRANEWLKKSESDPANNVWYCTLPLLDIQISKLPVSYRKQFAPKSYLLLYRTGFKEGDMPINEWGWEGNGYGNCGMVCDCSSYNSEKWIYYTNWTANNLGYRFRRASKDEVNAYVIPGSGNVDPETLPVVPPGSETPVAGETLIHVNCPHCGQRIF